MTQTQVTVLTGVLFGVMAFAALVARLLYRKLGRLCLHCGRRLAFFNELQDGEQQDIRRSLESFGHGPVPPEGVFACPHCGRVYGDLVPSGHDSTPGSCDSSYIPRRCRACQGWLSHPGGLSIRIKPGHPALKQIEAECVGCTRGPSLESDCVDCDTPVKLYLCRQCHAPHAWQQPPGQRFQYLLPLAQDENDPLTEPTEPS